MHTLPDLPYSYDALEPVISEQIMRLHHDKHHQSYVDKLNKALEEAPECAETSLVELLGDLETVPESVRQAVRNHGGGHYNHSLFWKLLKPVDGKTPSGELHDAIVAKWGSFDAFKEDFTTTATGLFGSGWVWLMPDFEIVTTPNQDTPMLANGAEPLLGLDVWEHAYYLDYKNVRSDYIKAWWNVVNWDFVQYRMTSLGISNR